MRTPQTKRKIEVQERDIIKTLRRHHPLVIEGMGAYDTRDPSWVASVIIKQLRARWASGLPAKPVLVVTQGDPYEPRGISAITRLVADELDVTRALVFLDSTIADYHAPNADRYKVVCEVSYSALVTQLQSDLPEALAAITKGIDEHLQIKNAKREAAGQPALRDYYRDFALLQEVTKVACKQLASHITVAHTSSDLSDYSVSSFYRVGLNLGLIESSDMVPFGGAE